MRVVPSALAQVAILIDLGPGATGIFRTKDATFIGFDDGPDAIGVHGRDGDADATEGAFGHAWRFREVDPGVAAVGGFPESTVGSTAFEAVGRADDLPDGSEHHVGVIGVDGEVDGAGLVGLEEGLLPGLATVDGFEDATLIVVAGHVAEGGDPDDVGVARVYADAADLAGFDEADILPGAASVHRFVDTVAVGGIAADAAFAHAGVDDVGVGFGDGDGADGAGFELAVGDGFPVGSGVGGFEDAAADCAVVVGVGLSSDAGDGDDAAGAEGSDGAVFEGTEEFGIVGGYGEGGQGEQEEEATSHIV